MPIYEYQCLECGCHFDLRQSVDPAAAVSPVKCPAGHTSVRRLLSRPAIIFKGSGFYVTDYGRNGKGKGSSQLP
ncbi:MAG: zinc ribbon domain-containing protein [Anaerolineae bacterium]|nr:zinc ribbon domain-containing protein [Anaerolineae bacterium]